MKKRKCNNCNEEMRELNYERYKERCLKRKKILQKKEEIKKLLKKKMMLKNMNLRKTLNVKNDLGKDLWIKEMYTPASRYERFILLSIIIKEK